MTIKDQLNAGMTPKQLLDDLNKQIMAAQREIDAEKKATAKKAEDRKKRIAAESKIVEAMENYFVALDVTPSPDWKENFSEMLSNLTATYEKMCTDNSEIKISKTVNGKKVDPTAEDVDHILNMWKKFFR